jgi:hypothetical protein
MNVNIGYAWAQLERARCAATEHADAEVRARARESVARWESVIAGMQAGTIDVGSRTPTSAPAWVTLDVATGGFATGGYRAGGPWCAHESALAERLGIAASRVALNLHYLMSAEASEMLASGCYRVDVPEEGAMLVIAWLRQRGEIDRANALIDVLAPWFATLRFYPVAAERPAERKETVRLQDLGTMIKGLDVDRRQRRFETMRESLQVWKPLRERAIALFAETVDGIVPRRNGNVVTGGLPGTRFPAGWHARVEQIVADLGRAGAPTTARAREVLRLITRLSQCASDPRSLAIDAYHDVRRMIGGHVSAHGLAGTPEHDARRAAELSAVAGPLHSDLRRVLVERLRALPADRSVEPERVLAAVTSDEAAQFGVPAGSALPEYFAPKVARGCDATLGELVERGVIASGEVFARVLPQVTSQVRAETLDDPAARRLYVALYTAFRRRRGLLLLHYQHQVRFTELPWVAALEAARVMTVEATSRARNAVADASGIALRAFPYTIIPNKLVTELYSLTQAAELKLPLVEELAADIFMGSFTTKFVEAAKISARLLAGTLYQRYYAIDVDEIARLPAPREKTSPEFAALCERRAAQLEPGSRSVVAKNGAIIEQAQILTTHNLGVLFDALPLRDALAPHLRPIAETCVRWAMRRLQLRASNWHQRLIQLKNAAYAWRQMVFYLSFCADAPAFLHWARMHFGRTESSFAQRFEPAMRGLELAVAGLASNQAAFALSGGRVFTGWSTDHHWLASSAVTTPRS